ncbi:MAG: methionine adenosyltransferase [Bacillota bacterium]|jgi:S-adenosylmethionine synthetase|nr:methionine adenosyltransferase [Bacillota bacterium]
MEVGFVRAKRLFTSESVTEGHPDKVCDQIADAVLDEILLQDPYARVACEVCATTGLVIVMGEFTCDGYVEIPDVVRTTVKEIGYTRAKFGFDGDTCGVMVAIGAQSHDIRDAVNCALEVRHAGNGSSVDQYDKVGAGDQGMMFGYACTETPELMPLPIVLAHRLAKRLAQVRREGLLRYLRPDGKTQVTVEYDDNGPVRVDTVVVSAQHDDVVTQDQLREDLSEHVIKPVIGEYEAGEPPRILVNPSGRFEKGGPAADSGLTGRKIIVDTYGGMCRHGGGAFSGKDPTKVDRSGSYAARHVAKNLVAAGAAARCEVQVAYAIGVARPVAIEVDTFGTGVVPDSRLAEVVRKVFDLRPAAIIDRFDLRRPIYRQVAVYGHFGRPDLDLPWERLDLVDQVKAML